MKLYKMAYFYYSIPSFNEMSFGQLFDEPKEFLEYLEDKILNDVPIVFCLKKHIFIICFFMIVQIYIIINSSFMLRKLYVKKKMLKKITYIMIKLCNN
jgi:hypothetical protein